MIGIFVEMFEMSAWPGQRYHFFDEISLLFETTQQSLGLKCWRVASNNNEIHQNNDNVVQVSRRLSKKVYSFPTAGPNG